MRRDSYRKHHSRGRASIKVGTSQRPSSSTFIRPSDIGYYEERRNEEHNILALISQMRELSNYKSFFISGYKLNVSTGEAAQALISIGYLDQTDNIRRFFKSQPGARYYKHKGYDLVAEISGNTLNFHAFAGKKGETIPPNDVLIERIERTIARIKPVVQLDDI